MTIPTSPAYIVKEQRQRGGLYRSFIVWNVAHSVKASRLYKKRRGAEKRCDELNAAALKSADTYRKAKDNG